MNFNNKCPLVCILLGGSGLRPLSECLCPSKVNIGNGRLQNDRSLCWEPIDICKYSVGDTLQYWILNQVVLPCYLYAAHKLYNYTYIQWTLELRPPWHTNNLGYDHRHFSFDLRPKSWVTTRMAFVSVSLNLDTRVCGRNSGQCIALYN
jgi:hypothetical protein